MRPVDVTTDAVADGAADERVREEMVAPRVARDAHRRRQAVCAEAGERAVVVFLGDDTRQRPSRDGVARGERVAAVEELAARVVEARAGPLARGLQGERDDAAVNQSLGAEQARLARPRVVRGATDEVERG